MCYRYLVSWVAYNNTFGYSEVELSKIIDCFDDIKGIADNIKNREKFNCEVIILNYQMINRV